MNLLDLYFSTFTETCDKSIIVTREEFDRAYEVYSSLNMKDEGLKYFSELFINGTDEFYEDVIDNLRYMDMRNWSKMTLTENNINKSIVCIDNKNILIENIQFVISMGTRNSERYIDIIIFSETSDQPMGDMVSYADCLNSMPKGEKDNIDKIYKAMLSGEVTSDIVLLFNDTFCDRPTITFNKDPIELFDKKYFIGTIYDNIHCTDFIATAKEYADHKLRNE